MDRAFDQAFSFDTFIFDLDGTLLDTLPDLVVLTNTVLREQGFPERTRDEVHSFVGGGAEVLIRLAVPSGVTELQILTTLARWRELYPVVGLNLTRPYPHMEKALVELKRRGARLGVVSNKFDQGVRDVIGSFMPGLFEVMHGECDGIPRKPDPTGLLHTIRELGSSPERTLYVGDSRTDIKTARNAGVAVASATWGYTEIELLRAAGPDVLLDDPRDLLDCMLGCAVG